MQFSCFKINSSLFLLLPEIDCCVRASCFIFSVFLGTLCSDRSNQIMKPNLIPRKSKWCHLCDAWCPWEGVIESTLLLRWLKATVPRLMRSCCPSISAHYQGGAILWNCARSCVISPWTRWWCHGITEDIMVALCVPLSTLGCHSSHLRTTDLKHASALF